MTASYRHNTLQVIRGGPCQLRWGLYATQRTMRMMRVIIQSLRRTMSNPVPPSAIGQALGLIFGEACYLMGADRQGTALGGPAPRTASPEPRDPGQGERGSWKVTSRRLRRLAAAHTQGRRRRPTRLPGLRQADVCGMAASAGGGAGCPGPDELNPRLWKL